MTAWSQSPFLQALGWAMLNSVWQMALLFAIFSVLQHFGRLSTHQKYYAALGSMAAGFLWFGYTFSSFLTHGSAATLLASHRFAPTTNTWHLLLSSASLTYLFLLLIPAGRLFKNWRFIEDLKKFGLKKAAPEHRLFVRNIAQRLGIRHTVQVFLSQLVQSPVTIGYLKPIILLPVAAINSLSPQQVEAVLLHELSHIRRYDYLVNLILTLLQTLFYFNPFVKKFVSIIELEREKCCDELVVQFQYDTVSYASALLLLEKNQLAAPTLAMPAAGKRHLLRRIEKIVGREEKVRFTLQQLGGIMASFVLVFFMNVLFFVKSDIKLTNNNRVFTAFENPLYEFTTPVAQSFSKPHIPPTRTSAKKVLVRNLVAKKPLPFIDVSQPEPVYLIPVSYAATGLGLTQAEKLQINQTLDATKKVLTKKKWKELEASIGDGMTAVEKSAARLQYLAEVNKIDWKKLKTHLESDFADLDWPEIEQKLNTALAELKLDSLQLAYNHILVQLEKAEQQAEAECKPLLPVPDASTKMVEAIEQVVKAKIDTIVTVRQRKVIDF